MTQLNLLPDVKLEFIKAQRMRRLIFSVSVLVAAAAVGLLVLLFSLNLLQKKYISDLNKDITADSKTLKNKPQIDRVLTVQNQLKSLTQLHSAKPAAARLFDQLNETTPTSINITSLDVDFVAYTITITGGADTLKDVNTYVDTLKFTTFTAKDNDPTIPADQRAKTGGKAFGNVVLSSFSLNTQDGSGSATAGSKPATYTVTLSYDPDIYNLAKDVKLSVPKKTTTRSALTNPAELFQNVPQTAAPAATGATGTTTTTPATTSTGAN